MLVGMCFQFQCLEQTQTKHHSVGGQILISGGVYIVIYFCWFCFFVLTCELGLNYLLLNANNCNLYFFVL